MSGFIDRHKKIKNLELVKAGAVMLPLFLIGLGAFSNHVRKEIGRRDRWTCQCCGNRFSDGWMVEAAHFDHDKSKPWYNSPENGRIECIRCHSLHHLTNFMGDPNERNEYITEKLVERVMQNGYHTYHYYETYPNQLDLDRQDFVGMLEQFDIKVWNYIDPEDLV